MGGNNSPIYLKIELNNLPIENIRQFNDRLVQINILNKSFTIVPEINENKLYELGYIGFDSSYNDFGLVVDRYLTPNDLCNRILELT